MARIIDRGSPVPKRRPVDRKKKEKALYVRQPVAQRQAQLRTRGVLAPSYSKTARQVHKEREAGREAVAQARKYISRHIPEDRLRTGDVRLGLPVGTKPKEAERIGRGLEILRKQDRQAQRKALLADIITSGRQVSGARLKPKEPSALTRIVPWLRPQAALGAVGRGVIAAGKDIIEEGPEALVKGARHVYPSGEGKKRTEPRTATIKGIPVPGAYSGGIMKSAQGAAVPFRAGANVAAVWSESPWKETKRFGKQLAASYASIPAGLYATAKDPEAAREAFLEDYRRRYAPYFEGASKEEIRKRLRKEGLAPEAFDLATIASGGGAVTGRMAQAFAQAGKLGLSPGQRAWAQRISTTRPQLRISGGAEGVRAQQISPNFWRNVVRAQVDVSRANRQARLVEEARKGPHRGEAAVRGVDAVREAAQAATEAGQHQVTRFAWTPLGKALASREQRREMIAAPAARERLALRIEQQHEIDEGYRQTLQDLSKAERKGLKYAIQFGIRTPDQAREYLSRYRDMAKAERQASGINVPKRHDELPDIQHAIDHADDIFTPKLAQAAHRESGRGARTAVVDPSLGADTATARRAAAQGALLGIHRVEEKVPSPDELGLKKAPGESQSAFESRARKIAKDRGLITPAESATDFARRVRVAAREKGLEAGGYFPSQLRTGGTFAARALGGARAVRPDPRWTGALQATARESTDPELLATSMARNIKRKHNWNVVAGHVERNAFEWSMGGKTIGEILKIADDKNLDLDSIAVHDPRKFRQHQVAEELDTEGGDGNLNDNVLNDRAVHEAVSDSTRTLREIKNLYESDPTQFADTGWVALPRTIHDELASFTKPSGAVGRIYDIGKGKVSRILLANPAWLQFQVASNAFLSGLAGVNPADMVRAQVWWKNLDRETKDAISPYIGVHKWFDEQPRLGAASNLRMVNAYRGFKTTKFYRSALSPRPGNVLDLIFKADNAQNNFFRKAVFYSKVKREAYNRMGQQAHQMVRLQDQLTNAVLLKKDPKAMMDALVKHQEDIERHAKHVNDFLGDYQTYTHRERLLLGRGLMFQGFLRFSLKFTFNTMPMRHPMVTSILAQMGRLQHDELKDLFGGDVPFWEIGKYYDPKTKEKIDLTRLNPYFNAVRMESPRSLLSMAPPALGMLVGQLTQETTLGQNWKIGGATAELRDDLGFFHPARYKILLGEVLRLSPYYRAAEKTGIPGVAKPLRGKQSTESSLLFPQATEYKREDAIRRQRQRIRHEEEKGAGTTLREAFVPLIPQEGAETIRQSKEYERLYGKKRKKRGGAAISTESYLRNLGRGSPLPVDPVQAYLNQLGG